MGDKWSPLQVPYAMELADRAPKERYYDPEFYRLECEQLWPRVWQMACRLEEIPEPGDFAEYENVGQAVVVVRTDDLGVVAFQNVCRHRGVKVLQDHGNCSNGIVCPFHGWCYGPDGTNTHVPQRRMFSEHNLQAGDIDLTPVRCETWGGCAWINLDQDAPPLRECIEPAASILDEWRIESLRAEWWYACKLPVNWKLAQQAFQEQYHVVETHPQLVIPGMRYGVRDKDADSRAFIEPELQYLRTMSDGMAGMVSATDVAIAEGLRDIDLPDDFDAALEVWHRTLNESVTEHHRAAGSDVPDLNDLEDRGVNEPMGYCFPHWFVLPMYSSASSYRFRPLGPEETLMEIWSLTRVAEGEERPKPVKPEVWAHDDPRWPPIPTQDFSNLPRQQLGLHAQGFEYMRLSEHGEGHLCNFERVLDGFLAGLSTERLLPSLREVNVNPLTRPTVDLDFVPDGVAMAAMDAAALHDKLEIHELLARYARGVDDRDWDLYRDVFTEDAHIDYTSAGAIAGSRDEVVAFMAEVMPTIAWSQHYITNVEIDLDGDTADVRAMFYNPMQLPGMADPSFCGGFYRHEVVRTPDGWRSRRLVEENRWFLNAPGG